MSRRVFAQANTVSRLVTGKPQTIRHLNRAAVLELIRQHQPLSRADLSRLTGIHRSNISIIVEDLQSSGLLTEERRKDAGRGRTPSMISLGHDTTGVIGVSLRVAQTTVVFATLDGVTQHSAKFTTPTDPAQFIEDLAEACASVCASVDHTAVARTARQMVISIAGIVTRTAKGPAKTWIPTLPLFKDFPLADAAEKKTGIPCLAANNSGLGAVAILHANERRQGWVNDFVFLVIGDLGVGSGVVIQKNLYSGYDAAYAGEIGHTVVDANGPLCNCGRRGCLQLYICDAATWKRFNPRLPFTAARFQTYLDDVLKGDAKALRCLEETAKYLSLGISNIALTLNPERIIVGGTITRVWSSLEPELKSAFFLPDHHALVEPIDVPIDQLFIRGAVERALSIVLTETAERRSVHPTSH